MSPPFKASSAWSLFSSPRPVRTCCFAASPLPRPRRLPPPHLACLLPLSSGLSSPRTRSHQWMPTIPWAHRSGGLALPPFRQLPERVSLSPVSEHPSCLHSHVSPVSAGAALSCSPLQPPVPTSTASGQPRPPGPSWAFGPLSLVADRQTERTRWPSTKYQAFSKQGSRTEIITPDLHMNKMLLGGEVIPLYFSIFDRNGILLPNDIFFK